MPPATAVTDICNRDISTAEGTNCSYFKSSWLETHRCPSEHTDTTQCHSDLIQGSNVSSVISPKTVTHVNMFTACTVNSASSYSNLWQMALSAIFASGLICRCTQNYRYFNAFPSLQLCFILSYSISVLSFFIFHITPPFIPHPSASLTSFLPLPARFLKP